MHCFNVERNDFVHLLAFIFSVSISIFIRLIWLFLLMVCKNASCKSLTRSLFFLSSSKPLESKTDFQIYTRHSSGASYVNFLHCKSFHNSEHSMTVCYPFEGFDCMQHLDIILRKIGSGSLAFVVKYICNALNNKNMFMQNNGKKIQLDSERNDTAWHNIFRCTRIIKWFMRIHQWN